MDDFVEVQVVHTTRDAHGPVNQERGDDFATPPQHFIQLALGAVFHQDTVTRSLGAHAPGRKHGSQMRRCAGGQKKPERTKDSCS